MSVSPKERVEHALKAIFELSECPSVRTHKLPHNPEICAKDKFTQCPEYQARKIHLKRG